MTVPVGMVEPRAWAAWAGNTMAVFGSLPLRPTAVTWVYRQGVDPHWLP